MTTPEIISKLSAIKEFIKIIPTSGMQKTMGGIIDLAIERLSQQAIS